MRKGQEKLENLFAKTKAEMKALITSHQPQLLPSPSAGPPAWPACQAHPSELNMRSLLFFLIHSDEFGPPRCLPGNLQQLSK